MEPRLLQGNPKINNKQFKEFFKNPQVYPNVFAPNTYYSGPLRLKKNGVCFGFDSM